MILDIATGAVYGEEQEGAEQFWTQRSGRKRVSSERLATVASESNDVHEALREVCRIKWEAK